MKRSEFLLRLAMDKKIAVVTEGYIDVTVLSDELEENISVSILKLKITIYIPWGHLLLRKDPLNMNTRL